MYMYVVTYVCQKGLTCMMIIIEPLATHIPHALLSRFQQMDNTYCLEVLSSYGLRFEICTIALYYFGSFAISVECTSTTPYKYLHR